MENKSMRSAGLSLAVVLLASVGLSGCVTVQPEDETATSSAPITSQSPETSAPSTPATETSAAPTSAEPTSPASPSTAQNTGTDFESVFASIVDAAEKKLECLDDDRAGREDADDLTISDNNIVISVTGDCDDVVITGNNLTIAIAEVDDLKVRGNNNMIAVQDLDDVEVHGSNNVVAWNPSYEDDPDLEDRGSNNILRHDALESAELNF